MKKSMYVARIAILAIVAVTFLTTSCDRKAKIVDPVRDVEPVDTTWWSGSFITTESGVVIESSEFPLQRFHELGDRGDTAAQHELFKKYLMDLTINVLSHYPDIATHENIHFYLVAGYASDVESGDGNSYSGQIRNELLISINDPTIRKTLFLACGNKVLFETSMNQFSYCVDWGTAMPWIVTIEEGENIAGHWSYFDVWSYVADKIGTPIVDSKGPISYLDHYISLLLPGDVINLIKLTAKDKDGRLIDDIEIQRREEIFRSNVKAAKG